MSALDVEKKDQPKRKNIGVPTKKEFSDDDNSVIIESNRKKLAIIDFFPYSNTIDYHKKEKPRSNEFERPFGNLYDKTYDGSPDEEDPAVPKKEETPKVPKKEEPKKEETLKVPKKEEPKKEEKKITDYSDMPPLERVSNFKLKKEELPDSNWNYPIIINLIDNQELPFDIGDVMLARSGPNGTRVIYRASRQLEGNNRATLNRYQESIETKLGMLSIASKTGLTCRSSGLKQLELMHSLGYMYLNAQIMGPTGFLVHKSTIFVGHLDENQIGLDTRIFRLDLDVPGNDARDELVRNINITRERGLAHQNEIEIAFTRASYFFPDVTI